MTTTFPLSIACKRANLFAFDPLDLVPKLPEQQVRVNYSLASAAYQETGVLVFEVDPGH
jgi:hypothetical protein